MTGNKELASASAEQVEISDFTMGEILTNALRRVKGGIRFREVRH